MNKSSSEGKWYVLYVKSRQENIIHNKLLGIGIESFLPKVKILKQWSDRKKKVSKPLFPSYVFVKISSNNDFHEVLSVDGVCSYIKFGREYAFATEKEINRLKFLASQDNISDIEMTSLNPKEGDFREITSGPFEGMECQIIQIKKNSKIIVRIESLKQNIIATIPSFSFDEETSLTNLN